MRSVNELVIAHLRENKLHYHEEICDGEATRLSIPYRGRNTGLLCGIEIHEDPRRMCVAVSNGVKAAPEFLPSAYELVARLNSGLALGAFWVDCDDGEITFGITSSLVETEPSDCWLGSVICTALYTFDKYCPAIAA